MVADGVASQPTYGTPSPQIAANGRVFSFGNWTHEITNAG